METFSDSGQVITIQKFLNFKGSEQKIKKGPVLNVGKSKIRCGYMLRVIKRVHKVGIMEVRIKKVL